MAIAFRASSSFTATSGSATTTQAITIAASVAFGDLVLIEAVCLPVTGTTIPVLTVQSSTGTTPTTFGSPATGSEPLPAAVSGTPFKFIASASDAGKVITFQSTIAGFWAISGASWSGVNPSVPISVVSTPAFGGANTASVTLPTITAINPSGSWAIFMGGGAAEGGALTGPSGQTQRTSIVSGADVASAIYDGNANVTQGGTAGGGTFSTASATNSILVGHTVFIGASATTHIVAQFASVDGSGVQTWNFTSDINGPGTQQLRILPPPSPSPTYQHGFLYMLPVVIGTSTANGDPPAIIESLGAHNQYNLTCVIPAYAIDPWFADNPNNAAQQQETFMLELVKWINASQFAVGGEKNYLIGFSKSGIGGQGLIFHQPAIWSKCASWDAPFAMTDFDGTDPTFGSTVGGNPANAYGTSLNFQNNYRLFGNTNIATWNTAAGNTFSTSNRLWIGGYFAFQADVAAYKAQLTSGGILHSEWNVLDASHAWQNDWVANALSSMLPAPGGLSIASGII